MAQQVLMHRIAMKGPGDMAGLQKLLDAGALNVRDIVAVLGKTEGNGGVNDFTREYAVHSVASTLAPYLECSPREVEGRIALIMSGGTEGVLSPHLSVFVRERGDALAGSEKRLAIGVAQTRNFLPEELGRDAQIVETARAVRVAMADAGIDDIADVHFVQVKCPLLNSERIEEARARGQTPVTDSAYTSMAYSRGASALGVAAALKEVPENVDASAVLTDWSLFSGVASTSAGIELNHNVVVLMGNSHSAGGDLVIGHAVMHDALDLVSVLTAFRSVGLVDPVAMNGSFADRVVNVFAKVESSPDGTIRGYRHTMLDDSDITPTRHARAAVGGLIAGVAGCGAIYVSGGAEHQGPSGGGPIAVIARAG